GIDAEDTALDRARDTKGALQIVGPNGAAQAVGRGVDFLQHFGFVMEGTNTHNRAKNFFAPDPVVGLDIENDGWFQKVTLAIGTLAAASNFAAGPLGFGDEFF